MYRYEQHCPVARAAEVLTQPWTLLILRELMRGSERRADIAKGVPKMSASLLGTRLRMLQNAGLVTHLPGDNGNKRYRLTQAGQELRPVVDHLGQWGQRWLTDPRLGDLDPELLLFDICQEIDARRLPTHALTVGIDFSDAPLPRHWLLELSRAGATACPRHPNGSAEVRLTCTLGALARVWLGTTTWLQAVRERAITLTGDPATVRQLIDCFGTSRYATVPKAPNGRPVGAGVAAVDSGDPT